MATNVSEGSDPTSDKYGEVQLRARIDPRGATEFSCRAAPGGWVPLGARAQIGTNGVQYPMFRIHLLVEASDGSPAIGWTAEIQRDGEPLPIEQHPSGCWGPVVEPDEFAGVYLITVWTGYDAAPSQATTDLYEDDQPDPGPVESGEHAHEALLMPI